MINTIETFWDFVDKTDKCWEWTGLRSVRRNGAKSYGVFNYRGKQYKAHRFAWYIKTGQWPTLFILHHCDNVICVNYEECLYEGTQQQNIKDRVVRNRSYRPKCLLGKEAQLYIINNNHLTIRDLADELTVNRESIRRVRNKTYQGLLV